MNNPGPQKQNVTADQAEPGDMTAPNIERLVESNNAFALALYEALNKAGGNLFFSPYSISAALAMTYAGARGETESQMARALRFPFAQGSLHPAFGGIQAALNGIQEKSDVRSCMSLIHYGRRSVIHFSKPFWNW